MAVDYFYSIDTSSLIQGWVRAYPIEVSIFKPVWQLLDHLISNGRLRASAEVLTEIRKKDDSLAEYCEARLEMFVEIKDNIIQNYVIEILRKYPRLVDTKKDRDGADPFVIAFAQTGTPYHTVVTEEKGGGLKSPRIPFVCQHKNIRCINLVQLIIEQSQE